MRLFFRLWLVMFFLAALWPVIPPSPAAAQSYYIYDSYTFTLDQDVEWFTMTYPTAGQIVGVHLVSVTCTETDFNGICAFYIGDGPTLFESDWEQRSQFEFVYGGWSNVCTSGVSGSTAPCDAFSYPIYAPGGTPYFNYNKDLAEADSDFEFQMTRWQSADIFEITFELIVDFDPTSATPTPTPQLATPFPVTQACIPGNLLPTRTPTAAARTPTPFGTRTPAATATLTATVVPATPAPAGLNILTDFTGSLSPWTQNGVSPLVAHSTDIGPNSQPGIVRMPFSDAPTENTPGQLSPPNITPGGNLLIYERLNMPRQLRVIADVQFPEMLSGTYTYIQVFYWPDDGLGTAAWVLAGNIRVNAAWHKITFYMNVPNTYGHPRAVALRAVSGISTIDNPLGFAPQAASGSVQLDNLRLVAGAEANDPTATGLPVCTGTGGGTGSTRPITKICQIAINRVDVFKNCITPENILDIGAWINWLWCRVSRYFSFVQENRQQLESLQSRQQIQQPVGPIMELPNVIDVFVAILADINATNNANAVYYRQFDFNRILDFGAWGSGDIFQIDFNAINTNIPDSRFDCEIGFSNLPVGMRRGVCFATNTVRESTPIIPAIQWLADIGAVVMLISYFRNTWMSKNE